MASYPMEPANPPFPALSSFHFQPEAGSHTSKRIVECLAGRITPATRQNAGTFSMGRPLGGLNFPAGIDCAILMVVSGSFALDREAQSAANAGSATPVAIRIRAAMPAGAAIVRMVSVGSLKNQAPDHATGSTQLKFNVAVRNAVLTADL